MFQGLRSKYCYKTNTECHFSHIRIVSVQAIYFSISCSIKLCRKHIFNQSIFHINHVGLRTFQPYPDAYSAIYRQIWQFSCLWNRDLPRRAISTVMTCTPCSFPVCLQCACVPDFPPLTRWKRTLNGTVTSSGITITSVKCNNPCYSFRNSFSKVRHFLTSLRFAIR